MSREATLDVLVPTCDRPCALAVTLTGLVGQSFREFRVVVSDQTLGHDPAEVLEVQAVVRVLRTQGHEVSLHKHLPRRGMAEHRQFLLYQARAPYVLFLDDDVIIEPDLVERLLRTIQEEGCGFVGSGLVGLSFADDVRPDQQAIELWEGPVRPEQVEPKTAAWERYRLHNAANLLHIAQRLGLTSSDRLRYKVAWVGGCVLYRTDALRACGGYRFWQELPPDHAGEDVFAQLRVMAAHGGCGILPSGAYHQELPTTIVDRRIDAPAVLAL